MNLTLRHVFLATLIFCLVGCGKTTIHIVEQGIEPKKVNKLISELKEQGFNVKRSNGLVPDEFGSVAVATNPSVTSSELLSSVYGVLDSLGFDYPTHYQFAQGNHFYSAQHMGLYLKDPEQRLMPPIMGSRRCGNYSATLEYFLDGKMTYEYEIQDQNGDIVDEGTFKGKFVATRATVTLIFDALPKMTLPIESDLVMTHVGQRRADYIMLPIADLGGEPVICRLDAVYE